MCVVVGLACLRECSFLLSADLPGWKRTLFLICGYEPPKTGVELSEEQKQEQTKLLTSIHEKTKWKWFVNINAIVLMTIGIFLWGYYA